MKSDPLIPKLLCYFFTNVEDSVNLFTLLDVPLPHFFDIDVWQCFSKYLSIDPPNAAWQQVQLCLSRGGLGFRSLSHAAFSGSLFSFFCSASITSHHLFQSLDCYFSPVEATSIDELLTSPKNQKELSSRIENSQF